MSLTRAPQVCTSLITPTTGCVSSYTCTLQACTYKPMLMKGLCPVLHQHAHVSMWGFVAQAYVDEATAMAAEEGGVLTAVKSLVQQPSDIWRKGSMLVTSMDNTVMVCDGVPQRVCALSSLCCGVSRAEPLVTMPGQLIALEVQKLPSATDPCTVLCRSRGSYWAIKVMFTAIAPAVLLPAHLPYMGQVLGSKIFTSHAYFSWR